MKLNRNKCKVLKCVDKSTFTSTWKEYGHIGEGFPTWTWGSRETFPEQRMSPLNSNESKNVLKCGLPGTSSKDSISVHEGGVNDYSVLRHREPGSAISRLDEVFFGVFLFWFVLMRKLGSGESSDLSEAKRTWYLNLHPQPRPQGVLPKSQRHLI